MATVNEMRLVSALEAIQHQLTQGEAAEGDKRDIAWCARTAGAALVAVRASALTGRERVVEEVRGALQAFADGVLRHDPVLLTKAREALASNDRAACATFLRDHLVGATDRNMLQAQTPTQQKAIYALYEDARYHLSVLDQLEWTPSYRAWSADGAVFDGDKFHRMEADGGFRGISEDKTKQLYWQDVLDHVLQGRFYAVRGKLRGTAHEQDATRGEGVQGSPMVFYVDNQDCFLTTEFENVGAGRNVAGLRYVIRTKDADTGKLTELLRIDDHMAMDSQDMAVFIRRQTLEQLQARLVNDASLKELDDQVREALASEDDPYTNGYRDAVESIVLALREHVDPAVLRDAVNTALDAYQNNAPELEAAGPAAGH